MDRYRTYFKWAGGLAIAYFSMKDLERRQQLGAKVRAVLKGRPMVSKEDIQAMAHPVLRHRLITNFTAEAEGITTDQIIDRILEATPAEESENLSDGKLPKVFGS